VEESLGGVSVSVIARESSEFWGDVWRSQV